MIFQRLPGKADGFISVKFPPSSVIRKKLPLLGVGKHCIEDEVFNIIASVHLTSSYVNQTRVSNRLWKIEWWLPTFKFTHYLCQEVPVPRATHDLQFDFDQKHYHSFPHKHFVLHPSCPWHWFLALVIKTAKKQWNNFPQPLDDEIHKDKI